MPLALVLLPYVIFTRNTQHFVIRVLVLEVMTINRILLYIHTVQLFELSLIYILIVFFVGEAVLGLALLVMVAQSKVGELLNITIF